MIVAVVLMSAAPMSMLRRLQQRIRAGQRL